MDHYHINLYVIERTMKQQFDLSEERDNPERPMPAARQRSRPTRLRLWLSSSLYELANALDPALPTPARQTAGHQH